MNNIFNYIIPKRPENQFVTATVSSLSPLQVKLYPDDSAITCKATTGLYGLKVGSNVVLMKIGNQFLIVNVIGTQINTYMDSIMINMNTSQVVTDTNNAKVLFNNQKVIVGNKLSFDATNYGVKIGAGVSAVDVNLTLWTERVSGSYSSIHIYKNSTQLTYNLAPCPPAGEERWTTQHSHALIDVTTNDLIYGYVRFNVADSSYNSVEGGYANSCNLTVKAIEFG